MTDDLVRATVTLLLLLPLPHVGYILYTVRIYKIIYIFFKLIVVGAVLVVLRSSFLYGIVGGRVRGADAAAAVVVVAAEVHLCECVVVPVRSVSARTVNCVCVSAFVSVIRVHFVHRRRVCD